MHSLIIVIQVYCIKLFDVSSRAIREKEVMQESLEQQGQKGKRGKLD